MTVQEIRETVNPMGIWMARHCNREAKKAITGNTVRKTKSQPGQLTRSGNGWADIT